ncbi:MAG: ribonuclease P protein component [Gammaproteobacteria bacterium]
MASKAEFSRVFDQPDKTTGYCFAVLARTNGLSYPRLGLAISRKAVPLAIARNRVKRLVRESFRCHQQVLGGVDIVVVSRSGVAERPSAVIFKSLEQHWQELSGMSKR